MNRKFTHEFILLICLQVLLIFFNPLLLIGILSIELLFTIEQMLTQMQVF